MRRTKPSKLLLTLIEKIRREPETETYHLLGYCYGTPLGGQLTQLLQAEKIPLRKVSKPNSRKYLTIYCLISAKNCTC